jgi:exopolyphosphatase / guanosine-5'-triphosphate,3'-diphosphate pyrophosphatase
MTIASIDIGSNTILLLIAEFNKQDNNIKALANYYESPRLSEGIKLGDKLGRDKINSLISVLNLYKQEVVNNNCEKVLIVATNAFRLISNSKDVLDEIRELFGWDIEIITGDEEARLTFLGSIFPISNDSIKNVIDIGGGSTEFIHGNISSMHFKKSFNIGVVSLTEKFFSNNPPLQKEISNALEYSKNIFSELVGNYSGSLDTIAVAGTPTTLSCIKQNIRDYNEAKVENSIIELDDIENITNKLSNMTRNQVLEQYGQVVIGREDVLLAGCLILISFMKQINIKKIKVSAKGLRYGVVVDFLVKNNLLNL